jgi:hypothetical protein
MRDAWASILNVPSGDAHLPLLLERLGRVNRLPYMLARELSEHELTRGEVHYRAIPPVAEALGMVNLQSPFSMFRERISAVMIAQLEVAADILASLSNSAPVEQGQVDALMRDVHDLIDQLDDVGLPAHIYQWVKEALEEIDEVLQGLVFFGTADLRSVSLRIVGSIVTSPDLRDTFKVASEQAPTAAPTDMGVGPDSADPKRTYLRKFLSAIVVALAIGSTVKDTLVELPADLGLIELPPQRVIIVEAPSSNQRVDTQRDSGP